MSDDLFVKYRLAKSVRIKQVTQKLYEGAHFFDLQCDYFHIKD